MTRNDDVGGLRCPCSVDACRGARFDDRGFDPAAVRGGGDWARGVIGGSSRSGAGVL